MLTGAACHWRMRLTGLRSGRWCPIVEGMGGRHIVALVCLLSAVGAGCAPTPSRETPSPSVPVAATAGRPVPQPTGPYAPSPGAPTWCASLVDTGLGFVSTDVRDLGIPERAEAARGELSMTATRLRGLSGVASPSVADALRGAADAIDGVTTSGIDDSLAVSRLVSSLGTLGKEAQTACGFPL